MRKMVLVSLSMLFLFGALMANADQKTPWQRTLRAVGKHQVVKANLVSGSKATVLDEKQYKALLNASESFKVLENPTCRCMPQVKYNVVIFLSNADMLVIQAVKGHWFQAVFFYRGQVITFLLQDKNDDFYNAVEKVMNPQQASTTPKVPMCSECAGKMFIMSIGTCQECGGATSSGAFKYCEKCARKLGVCQSCGKKLK